MPTEDDLKNRRGELERAAGKALFTEQMAEKIGNKMAEIKKRELLDRIENDFIFHPAKPEQATKYTVIRARAKDLALLLVELCPMSRELSVALTHLDEMVFNANAAIARNS